MAKFAQRPLALLERVYRFVGGQRGSSAVDLASPIVRVHDVSRMAELSAATNRGSAVGFFAVRISHTHTGVSTTRTAWNPYELNALASAQWSPNPVDPSQEWVWLMAAGIGINDAADFDRAGLVILQNLPPALTVGVGGTDTPMAICNWGDGTGWAPSPGTQQMGRVPAPLTTAFSLPQLIGAGGVNESGIEFISASDNGGTCVTVLNATVWRGPKGVMPPGLS